jgi:hypothetical protein
LVKEVGDKMKRMRQYFSSKVDSEVPSEVSGIFGAIICERRFSLVGQTIAIIETKGGEISCRC